MHALVEGTPALDPSSCAIRTRQAATVRSLVFLFLVLGGATGLALAIHAWRRAAARAARHAASHDRPLPGRQQPEEALPQVSVAEADGAPARASEFPRVPTSSPEFLRVPPSSHPGTPGEHPALCGKRVLIVAGCAAERETLSLHARSWGMAPQVVASGGQALHLVGQGAPFDLAILDLPVPGTDALALAQQIRGHRAAAALPSIALTPPGEPATDAWLDLFAAALAKPVTAPQLRNALIEVCVVGEGVRMRREEP